MRLLILTQVVDKNDPGLSFIHKWIEEFATKFESIVTICLKEGEHSMPDNVRVLSLGKPNFAKASLGEGRWLLRLKYLWNFYKYIWRERKNYDAVFVHMNQEYVLLGWKSWWLMGKPIYMWRNHHDGSWLTDLAALFCKKVFCTSKFSYTAKYRKTVLMPVGVDTRVFGRQYSVDRKKHSILFLGRIAPVKKPDLLIDALGNLKDLDWSLTIVGDALPKDMKYYLELKKKCLDLGIVDRVVFKAGVPNTETPAIYNAHEIFVNLSSSGMYDKTILEAMACGCLVLASNENLRCHIDERFIFGEDDKVELGRKINILLELQREGKDKGVLELRAFSEKHDINALANALYLNLND